MTLPFERSRALVNTREFLRSLLDPRKTPRVPMAVRQQAASCLRHYPWDLDIEAAAEELPDVFGPINSEERGD